MTTIRILVACCLVAVVSACSDAGGGEGNDQPELAEGATFTTSINADPGNLHPLTTVSAITNSVVTFAYDSLILVDPEGEIRPYLAEDWEVTGARVTFTLREGITCEDGTELTADAVAANFEWIADPENASPRYGSGLENYTVDSDDVSRTVTITLEKPFGFLLENAGSMLIVCPGGLADPKSLSQETDGTGPFALSDYVADDHVTMTAREGYAWGPDGASTAEPGFPAEVVIRVVRDPSTAVNLFLAGELNDIGASGPDEARLEGQGFDVTEFPGGPAEMWFNQREGLPTADPDVRRAITMALDLDALTPVLTEQAGERAHDLTTILPDPCRTDSIEGTLPEFDPEGAGELLDSAGWTTGSDGVRTKDGQPLSLTASYASGEPALDAGLELVTQLLEDVGVEVELKGEGQNAFLATLFEEDPPWELAFLSAAISYPSGLVVFASGPLPPQGQNFAAIDNPDYERLADEAQGTPGQEGCELWAQAEGALFERADIVPIAITLAKIYTRGASYDYGLGATSIRMYR